MRVLRKMKVDTNVSGFKIGDQIEIELKDLGKFTATVQRVTDKDVLFLFDDCVVEKPINYPANIDSFEKSDLNRWLHTEFKESFPIDLAAFIDDISIPSVGQMFGHNNDFYQKYCEADNDEQFELMKKRHNRQADFNDDDFVWYWLKNKIRVSSGNFAAVGNLGHAGADNASNSNGVRPYFTIKL